MERLPLILCMERGPNEGASFDCTKVKRVTVGRTRQNNYQIKRSHSLPEACSHRMEDDRWSIVDVGSSNGTAINGIRLETGVPMQLSADDLLIFGEEIKVRVHMEQGEKGPTVEQWFALEGTRSSHQLDVKTEAIVEDMKKQAKLLKQAFRAYARVE